ncbi:Light-harvesting complex-like protein 3 isotype 1, chloroplastic [Linum perenne]
MSKPATPVEPKVKDSSKDGNGAFAEVETKSTHVVANKFADSRWIGGTWDLKQFRKDRSTTTTDWDAVIDAGKELTFGAKGLEEEMATGQP